jgi:2-methylcitrate dehydratase PrpD
VGKAAWGVKDFRRGLRPDQRELHNFLGKEITMKRVAIAFLILFFISCYDLNHSRAAEPAAPARPKGEQETKKQARPGSGVIREVSLYISRSGDANLPPEVIRKAKHHILDTLAAIVSGSEMKAGKVAIPYVKSQGGVEEAQVIGSKVVTSAINAAFANAMMAHADETDDSHEKSLTHPGCAVVPAALAVAEREGADGIRFLKAVVAGYDVGTRFTMALGVDNLRSKGRSTHATGGNFGAAAAAASVLQLDAKQVSYVLDYASNQSAGALHYVQDEEHVEKAFVFAGMPAQSGATAALLVRSGFTGVADIFTGSRNFLEPFLPEAKPERWIEGQGKQYEVMSTNIKKFAVGSPIQAPVDALILLMKKHQLTPANVQGIAVRFADERSATTVNDRDMPDVNLQYSLAMTLLEGDLSFEASHSRDRMKDPAVLDIKKRVSISVDPGLLKIVKTERQAVVEVTTKDGTKLTEHVFNVRGTAENPLTSEEVEKKCRELMIPVLGKERTDALIDTIWNLERVKNVRELRPFLSAQ